MGQSLSVFNVDASMFPLIKAKMFAFDAAGLQVTGFTPSDISIVEDGVPRTVQLVSCPPANQPIALSAVLAIDVSGSMKGDGIKIARAAARAFVKALPLGKSECAITSFNDKTSISLDFSTDSTVLIGAINALATGGLTDYNVALLGTPAGAFQVASAGKAKRVVVFLSDGQPNDPPDQAAIIAEALSLGITVYAVMFNMPAPVEMQTICEATGGEWFEHVDNERELTDIYRRILQTAQGGEPCRLEWISDGCATSHRAACAIPSIGAVDTVQYAVPIGLLPQISYSPSNAIHFGEVVPTNVVTRQIRLNAVGVPARVDSITKSDSRFRVLDYGGPVPFTLTPGVPQTLTIEFAPGDSAYAFCVFTVHGDACMGRPFYADGGWRGHALPRIKVRVVRPNGGNVFVVASDELLTWDNVMPDEKVRLEYSIDNGSNWRLITDTASGLQYMWHVPRTPSSECLLRATAHMPATYLENLVEIPAGVFRMGDVTGNGIWPEEHPVHEVTISQSILMGATEVTQAQWTAVMGYNPSHFQSDSLPVEGVRWIDAVEFCNKLSIQEKLDTCYRVSGDTVVCDFNASGFRLPTEAEWEYACKAGTETDYYTGNMSAPDCDPLDQALDRAGWYCGNDGQRTQPVGRREPNAFGMFDMHGNVYEWCWDWYSGNAYGSSPVTDPRGPASGAMRVVRGGSVFETADMCRSASRSGNTPTDRFTDIGFRIVRVKK
jgi:formylglycine-generating enzyme required for sulfatase activity